MRDCRARRLLSQKSQNKKLKRHRCQCAQDKGRPQGKPFSLHGLSESIAALSPSQATAFNRWSLLRGRALSRRFPAGVATARESGCDCFRDVSISWYSTGVNAIQTEALTKRFGRVNALNGLGFCVPQGAVHALVGPNGAGKTTLIKILMNIFRASSGTASVLGVDSRKVSGKAFASIGYVSENQQLPGWMRVGSFLAYLRPFYPTWDNQLETQLVQSLDLPLDRKLKQLSRGMRMKAALASALAFRPKLIVLDEPFSGLDPMVRDELGKALFERAGDSTVFLSSHDLAEIEGFATHVAFLDGGRLQLSEEMSSLSARFRDVELTFDVPVTVPPNLPASWHQVSASGSVVRFVDSAFNAESIQGEIAQQFGPVKNSMFSQMSLRSIFLALAKGNRRPL